MTATRSVLEKIINISCIFKLKHELGLTLRNLFGTTGKVTFLTGAAFKKFEEENLTWPGLEKIG